MNFEQCHHSYSGCYFCRKCRGKYYIFKKHLYGGHRGLSPFNHILRKYGQSKSCCSNNFYLDTYDKHYVKEYNVLIKRVNIDMPITDEERRKTNLNYFQQLTIMVVIISIIVAKNRKILTI